jgi:hypothetical protein
MHSRDFDDNDIAKAAVQLITERSSHIPTYTPVVMVGEAKRDKKASAEMRPEKREEFKVFVKGLEENARRGYEEATVVIREFYGSLTQLLTRFAREPFAHEPDQYVGVGVWRILDSYHPNLRFYVAKPRQRHTR